MAKKTQTYYCHSCGCELSSDNCRKTNNSISGYSHLCVFCENDFYQRLASIDGDYIALFHACAALDARMYPLVLDGKQDTFNDDKQGWITYINALSEQNQDTRKGKILGFADGMTSLIQCFGNGLEHKDFAAYIAKAKAAIDKKPKPMGTDEQRAKFGTLPIYKGLNFTQELYDELDRLLDIRVSSYKGQDLSGQQMSTLIKCAKNDAIYDHLMRTGLAKLATDIQKSTSQLLADENMRPKDKKPVEELRLDALVLALEDAGLMENGDLLTYDELIEVMRDKFIKSPKYNYSLDVADQMILDVINSMRQNADLPTIQDLPEEFAPVDEYGEFTPEETEREKENKKYLGITKVNVVKSDKGEN